MPEPAVAPTPVATVAPAVSTEPTAAASPTPAPSASAAPAAPADANAPAPSANADLAPGMITVTVNSVPPKAQFFHFGKQVGTAPFVVQLKPGERHAYEVGLPGRVTRKLVLDGTKTEITVGLRPNP